MDIRQREDFGVGVKTAFVKDPDGNVIEMTDVPALQLSRGHRVVVTQIRPR
jgi:hypothetical protein